MRARLFCFPQIIRNAGDEKATAAGLERIGLFALAEAQRSTQRIEVGKVLWPRDGAPVLNEQIFTEHKHGKSRELLIGLGEVRWFEIAFSETDFD